MDYLVILYRTIISYLILVVSLRLMGKREIGQLSLFDLIILLSIADIMVIGIENFDEQFFYVILPVIILTLLQKLVAFVLLKSVKLRKLIDGKPSIVVMHGKLCIKEMKKQAYNMEDLLLQLRTQGVFDIKQIEYAILETNGKLSIMLNKDDTKKISPFPVINSGKIDYEVLNKIGKNEEWINKKIGKNHLSISEISCAYVEENELIIIEELSE